MCVAAESMNVKAREWQANIAEVVAAKRSLYTGKADGLANDGEEPRDDVDSV